MLTQERLKELLHYCPDTGVFTRKTKTSKKAKVGGVVGYKCSEGYLATRIDGKLLRLHRLAFLYMTGSFPLEHTDHVNQVRHDNRWENLRAVTQGENMRNKSIQRRNKSGCPGVFWYDRYKKWEASIRVDDKKLHLGRFADKGKAVEARKKAEIEHGYHVNHGKQAILNS